MGIIFGLRKRSYIRNSETIRQAALPDREMHSDNINSGISGMINGQALGVVSRLRYGLCPMSFNGCEVISVYNAMQYLGKPCNIADIALYMERFRVLIGFFGCNVYRIGKALTHFGAEWKRIRRKVPGDTAAFIISFWTGRRLLSSVHTVFCIRKPHGILVYNRYNSCGTVQLCRSMEELAGKYPLIAAYAVTGVKQINSDQE
ncbi:MAG: hypothetical protein IJ737_01520 [Ruminococcus sp.]|nr:hypothetical protein [Ruminococcus sp.]MBR2282979.1 hypothetical protein [Ruminococcus sp.]